eukprot:1181312-Prorocentrum_minimum.AAC.4
MTDAPTHRHTHASTLAATAVVRSHSRRRAAHPFVRRVQFALRWRGNVAREGETRVFDPTARERRKREGATCLVFDWRESLLAQRAGYPDARLGALDPSTPSSRARAPQCQCGEELSSAAAGVFPGAVGSQQGGWPNPRTPPSYLAPGHRAPATSGSSRRGDLARSTSAHFGSVGVWETGGVRARHGYPVSVESNGGEPNSTVEWLNKGCTCPRQGLGRSAQRPVEA